MEMFLNKLFFEKKKQAALFVVYVSMLELCLWEKMFPFKLKKNVPSKLFEIVTYFVGSVSLLVITKLLVSVLIKKLVDQNKLT